MGSDPSSFRKKFFKPKPISKEEVKYAEDFFVSALVIELLKVHALLSARCRV